MLDKDFIQGLNGTTIKRDRMLKTDPSVFDKMYVMSINYNGAESYLFINGIQVLKFTAAASNLGKINFVEVILVTSFHLQKWVYRFV